MTSLIWFWGLPCSVQNLRSPPFLTAPISYMQATPFLINHACARLAVILWLLVGLVCGLMLLLMDHDLCLKSFANCIIVLKSLSPTDDHSKLSQVGDLLSPTCLNRYLDSLCCASLVSSFLFFTVFSKVMCSTIISSITYYQPLPRVEERLVSTNPTLAAAVTMPKRDVTDQIGSSYTSGTLTPVYPQEQTYFYGG